MCFNVFYIEETTVVKELVKRVINVFAERLKLESPFVSALTACIRAFLFDSCFFVAASSGLQPNLLDSLSNGMGFASKEYEFKGYSFNRSFLCRLRVDKRMEQKNIRLCDRLSNLNLETRVKKRDQGLLPSCELTGFTKRLIDGEGLISTLICYMQMILLGSRGKAVLTLK
jgi:hypothetical protein